MIAPTKSCQAKDIPPRLLPALFLLVLLVTASSASGQQARPPGPFETQAQQAGFASTGQRLDATDQDQENWRSFNDTGQIPSLAGWRAYRNYLNSTTDRGLGREFARVGPVNFQARGSFGFGYDTNLNSSPTQPLSDAFVESGLRLGLFWQATRRNSFRLELGINQREYLSYPQFSNTQLILDPVTSLEYSVFVGDFVFTLYDYPQVTSDGAQADPSLVNLVNFQQLRNQLGFSVLWHLNRLILSAGFERQDTLSLNNEFSSLNSTGYAMFLGAFYQLSPRNQVGLRFQVISSTQEQTVLNDSLQSQMGAFWQAQLTDYTDFYLEAGVQAGSFSETGQQVDEITFDTDGEFNVEVAGTLGGGNYFQPYFSIGIQNQLNRFLTQSLRVQRSVVGSVLANYREQNTLGYLASWRMNRLMILGFGADYNFGTLSSSGTPVEFNNFTARLALSANLVRNLDSTLSFSHLTSFTGEEGSYQRNIVSFSFSYNF